MLTTIGSGGIFWVTGPVLKSPKLSPQTEFGILFTPPCCQQYLAAAGILTEARHGTAKLSPQTEFGIRLAPPCCQQQLAEGKFYG
eukprot:CCRYP_015566-RF/>CCRYP_015566-RF protein AED:0.29 eAED:0.29 QI:44/1/1/1/0/0/3/234/84